MKIPERIPPTPAFLIATAGAFLGVKEEGGNNRGQMVERFLASVGMKPGLPWCAAFVYYVGYWSHYDHIERRSWWPLPNTASCLELGRYARIRKILEKEPAPGDVFLIHDSAKGRFTHTGIILQVTDTRRRQNRSLSYECTTIEGNTNEQGTPEANTVTRKVRWFHPDAGDRFIRWVNLDKRGEEANPKWSTIVAA